METKQSDVNAVACGLYRVSCRLADARMEDLSIAFEAAEPTAEGKAIWALLAINGLNEDLLNLETRVDAMLEAVQARADCTFDSSEAWDTDWEYRTVHDHSR